MENKLEKVVKIPYCTRCGTKHTEHVLSGFYDKQTGEAKSYTICRKCLPCDHEWQDFPWWNFMYDFHCKKCGIKETSSY